MIPLKAGGFQGQTGRPRGRPRKNASQCLHECRRLSAHDIGTPCAGRNYRSALRRPVFSWLLARGGNSLKLSNHFPRIGGALYCRKSCSRKQSLYLELSSPRSKGLRADRRSLEPPSRQAVRAEVTGCPATSASIHTCIESQLASDLSGQACGTYCGGIVLPE